MRAAISLALLLAACGGSPDDQPANDAAAPVEIEALPADESVATTSSELANGVNEPDAADLGNQH